LFLLFVPKPSGPVDWPTMGKLAVAVALSFGVTIMGAVRARAVGFS
jgi:hypothetical protein